MHSCGSGLTPWLLPSALAEVAHGGAKEDKGHAETFPCRFQFESSWSFFSFSFLRKFEMISQLVSPELNSIVVCVTQTTSTSLLVNASLETWSFS